MDQNSSVGMLLKLSVVRTRLTRDLERRISSHGIGLSDLALLVELDAAGGKVTRSELAERLGVTTSGIARQVQPLERIGLVAREVVEKDARMSLVTITKSGRRALTEVVPDAEERATELLESQWSRSEIDTLKELLASVR